MTSRWLLPLPFLVACGDNLEPPPAPPDPTPAQPTCSETDLQNTLSALDHVTSVAEQPCGQYVLGTARCFLITFEQPIRHDAEGGATFQQRLFLTHRGCDRSNVIADWGYSNDYGFYDDELAGTFRTNALWIEHRYQGESVPAPTDWDWTALTIENGADDMHSIIQTFRKHYGGRFVTTGASKGGITATYHKFFFPKDVDGAIPYVAPASRARVDGEYQAQLDARLPDPCAQKLRDAQVAALTTRRQMMIGKLVGQTQAGTEPLLLEYITETIDWAFWQYYGIGYCNRVPATTASDDVFFNFFATFSGLNSGSHPAPATDPRSDSALSYEWLTEQGFALQVGKHVAPLLQEPLAKATMEDDFRMQNPGVELPDYDGSLTAQVRRWSRNFTVDTLFIYGQYDPWSIGGGMEVPIRDTSAQFFVPNATHGAQMRNLADADRTAAMAIASRLIGHDPTTQKPDLERAAAIHDQLLRFDQARAFEVGLRMKGLRR